MCLCMVCCGLVFAALLGLLRLRRWACWENKGRPKSEQSEVVGKKFIFLRRSG